MMQMIMCFTMATSQTIHNRICIKGEYKSYLNPTLCVQLILIVWRENFRVRMISKIWHGKFRFWGERKTWYSHVQEEKSVKRHYWLQKREDGSKRSDSLLYSYAHFPSPWKIPPLHAFLLCFSSFFTFVMEKWWKKIEKTRKSGKNIISTSKRHAEHPFAGQNTQQKK